MRRALPLVLAALLAGCTLGPPAADAPRGPALVAGPCGTVDLRADPPRFALGGDTTLVATFRNCGDAPLALGGSDRCGRGEPLAVRVGHMGRSYLVRAPEEGGVTALGDLPHHGSCGPIFVGEPPTVPPGGNRTRAWTWDGSRALLLTWWTPIVGPAGTGTSIRQLPSPEPILPGTYRLTLTVAAPDRSLSWTTETEVRIEGEPPAGPERRDAYTRWRPQPGDARPRDRDLPDDPEQAALVIANGSLASRLGPGFFERHARLVDVGPDERNASCPRPTCDRWLVQYDLRLPDLGVSYPIGVAVVAGAALDTLPVEGVPDCRERVAECSFGVDRDRARALARQHGLADPPEPVLVWHAVAAAEGTLGTYAWRVGSLLLDANDGTRLDA